MEIEMKAFASEMKFAEWRSAFNNNDKSNLIIIAEMIVIIITMKIIKLQNVYNRHDAPGTAGTAAAVPEFFYCHVGFSWCREKL